MESTKKGAAMHKTRGVSHASRINFPELLSRVDNDRELLVDLFNIFKEEFPRHLQALHDAVALHDMNQTATVSHTLKGMLLNLAVTRAAKAAGQLEQLAHEGAKASVLQAFTAFEMEVQGLLPEMEIYKAEVWR
jgi:two-component system, sensor histidine kinase and response regulator